MKNQMRFFSGLVVMAGFSGCMTLGPQISGQIFCGDGGSQSPAAKARVELKKGLEVVATTTADANGKYSLKAPQGSQASHILSAQAACGNASKVLSAEAKADQNLSLFK